MHGETSDPDVGPEARIRVALIGCTGVLGDIIRNAVTGEVDMDVVVDQAAGHGPDQGPDRWPDRWAARVDVVVWNHAERAQVERLMVDAAQVAPLVLATVDDGRRSELWQLVPRLTVLSALSPAALVQRIRSAAQPSSPHLT